MMPASDLCQVCGSKPKYVDDKGLVHQFCSRTCARQRNTMMRSSSIGDVAGCNINGCRRPEDAAYPGYCSFNHAKQAVSSRIAPACTRCRVLPQSNGPTCNGCAPTPPDEIGVGMIKRSSTVWREFEREWSDKWKTGTPATIEKLFEITYPDSTLNNKKAFRQSLESEGGARLLRTFHASQCICDMGTKGAVLCDWNSCGICNIVKSSFECVAFGARGHSGSCGFGLYSSTDPSREDPFATSCVSSPYRVMIACDVVVPQMLAKNKSVLMEDRVMVREPGTITPRFIVMYRKGI